MIGKAAAVDPLVPVGPRFRKPRFGVIDRSPAAGGRSIRGRRTPARRRAGWSRRAPCRPRTRAADRCAAAAPAQSPAPRRRRRRTRRRRAASFHCCGRSRTRLAVELEIDEAVEAAEGAQQDVLGDAVARCADDTDASGPRRPRSRSGARRAPRASRSACPMSFPGSSCPAGSGGRPGPSGPADPRGTAAACRSRIAAKTLGPSICGRRQPLDVPARRDERANFTVRQQRVIGNRRKRASTSGNLVAPGFAGRQLAFHVTTVLQAPT